jgi:hypothetical protein
MHTLMKAASVERGESPTIYGERQRRREEENGVDAKTIYRRGGEKRV